MSKSVTKPDKPLRRIRGGSVLGNDWEQLMRTRIQKSAVVNRLIRYVQGEISLEASQVTAAIHLMKKVLPDVVFIESKSTVHHVIRAPLIAETEAEWQQHIPIEHRKELVDATVKEE